MADQIQLHLESRLPELDELVSLGVFSQDKIKEIVKSRTKFEYRLKRRGVEVGDFVKYIEYEKRLEVERAERFKLLGIKARDIPSKFSLIQHIYGLYQRAIAKFKGEAEIWKQFLLFSWQTGSHRLFKKVIMKAIRIIPSNHDIWILASRHEWEINGNVNGARRIFHQALRLHSSSPELWLTFFKLEVDFVLRLRERRRILNISEDSTDDVEVINGALAIAVVDAAFLNVPKIAPSFAMALVAQLDDPQGNLQAVNEHVWGKIATLIKSSGFLEGLLDNLSSRECSIPNLKILLRLLDAAFAEAPSSDILASCVKFLLKVPELVCHDNKDELHLIVYDKIDQIFLLSQEKNVMTASLYVTWIGLIHNLGYDSAFASSLIERALSEYPNDADLNWIVFKERLAQSKSMSELHMVTDSVPKQFENELKGKALETLIDELQRFLPIEGFVTAMSILMPFLKNPSITIPAKFGSFLHEMSTALGIEKVRELCTDIARSRPVSGDFYLLWISVEIMSVSADISKVRSLYLKAVALDASNVSLWLSYFKFERSNGCFTEAASVLVAAKRNIPEIDIYIDI